MPVKEVNLSQKIDLSKMSMDKLKNLLMRIKDKNVRKMIRKAIGKRHKEHARNLMKAKKKRKNRNHKK